jgi:hypothetical protein
MQQSWSGQNNGSGVTVPVLQVITTQRWSLINFRSSSRIFAAVILSPPNEIHGTSWPLLLVSVWHRDRPGTARADELPYESELPRSPSEKQNWLKVR